MRTHESGEKVLVGACDTLQTNPSLSKPQTNTVSDAPGIQPENPTQSFGQEDNRVDEVYTAQPLLCAQYQF
jgi:hypothetical protein